jgi:hypothetical protein
VGTDSIGQIIDPRAEADDSGVEDLKCEIVLAEEVRTDCRRSSQPTRDLTDSPFDSVTDEADACWCR